MFRCLFSFSFWFLWCSRSRALAVDHGVALLPLSIPGEIPGGSNLKFCPESRQTDLFSIKEIQVHPTPPKLERSVSIYIEGNFLEDITPDPLWDYVVDVNNGTGLTTGTIDFCDAMEEIQQPDPSRKGHMCPPEKGFAMITIRAFLPWYLGEGEYRVKFDAKTQEGERIYCLEAEFYLGEEEREHREAETPASSHIAEQQSALLPGSKQRQEERVEIRQTRGFQCEASY